MRLKTIIPLIAAGALLADCGTGQAASDASSSTPSESPETTSGTILQGGSSSSDAVYDPDDPAPAGPDRVEPDPEWPKDSVVFINPESGDVVRTIDVPDELECAP